MDFVVVNRSNIDRYTDLMRLMYKSRYEEFVLRQKWALDFDDKHQEKDQFDNDDATYIIARKKGSNGKYTHLASTRLIPTTKPTMVREVFGHMIQDESVYGIHAWETTRLFAEPGAGLDALSAVMFAGMIFGLENSVEYFISVTPPKMARVFGFCGWRPQVIGRGETKEGQVYVCKWPINEIARLRLRARLGIGDGDEARTAA